MSTKQHAEIGDNRTTRAQRPASYVEMESGTKEFPPTSAGDGPQMISDTRGEYAKQSGPLGHVPPLVKPKKPSQELITLVDKLGQRLAFERQGTRLYELLISKHDAYGSFPGGPSRDDLVQIRREEHEHFLMLERVMTDLGADPAAVTPSADLTAVVARGVNDALADPRVSLVQSLDAILVAELNDTASWALLTDLARAAGQEGLAAPFARAHRTEEEHVTKVTAWLRAGLRRG